MFNDLINQKMELKKQTNEDQGENISKNDLKEIFSTQYSDLFSKLLKKSLEEFISLLKQQIIIHLRIINKQCDFSLLTNFYQKYESIAKKDKNKIQKIYDEIKTYQDKDLNYLDILDIYIHCFKCKEAIHKCGNKLIFYENLFFCIKCQKVYDANQIKLYCKECNKTYLTTKRDISEKKNKYFYSTSYIKYHCFIENEEKIKCLNCNNDLYYNININKEHKCIRDIFCIQCKLIFDTKEVFFTCKICGENFKAEPQIYRNYPSIKKYLLLLVHTFRKNIYALPDMITNKKCNCDLNGVQYFLHKDNGRLYEGNKNGKNVIICDHCYGIFKNENFNWNCPFCGGSFKAVKKNKNFKFNKNKKKISANNTNIKALDIINDEENNKNKTEKGKSNINMNINKKRNNHIFFNSIVSSNARSNNCESSKQLSRDLSLSNRKGDINLLDPKKEANINGVDIFKSDKKLLTNINDNKKYNTTVKKEIKINGIKTQKIPAKYKRIKPAKLFKDYEKGNSIKSIPKRNNNENMYSNNESIKRENKRSLSYLNKNYNINKDINNINENSPKKDEEDSNRALSSLRKVLISDCKPLFKIKESINEESLENTSSEKKNIKKFKRNIENVIPQNLFLKNKNNNCNNNNISISINNNVIQLRCSPNIKSDNNIQKIKNENSSPDSKLLSNSSSNKIIKEEHDDENNLTNSNKEIYKRKKIVDGEKIENIIKGKSVQKNYTKMQLNTENIIIHNKEDINLIPMQSINNKIKKIKNIRKIVNFKEKGQNLTKEDIINNKNIVKIQSKIVLKKKKIKNEILNNSKVKDKDDINNIQSEKKPNLVPRLSIIPGEEKNDESLPKKKINKVKIKKISDNQINKSKNIKIINSSKNSNPNVYIIANISKNNNSNNEENINNYNSIALDNKKDINNINNNILNIITDENNNIIYTIPNNTKNQKIFIQKNKNITNEIEENINTNNFIYKSKNYKINNNIINQNYNSIIENNGIHKKNNLSFHVNNISEIKNVNSKKKDIISISNKKKRELVINEISPEIIKNINKKPIKSNKNTNNNKIIYSHKKNTNNNNNINNIANTKEIFGLNKYIKQNIEKSKNENCKIDIINKPIHNNNKELRNENINNNIVLNIIDLNNNNNGNNEDKNHLNLDNNDNNDDDRFLDLKIYFASLEKEIAISKQKIKRSLSFDIRNSISHFSLLTNPDNFEVKTFDSNYYTILRQIGKGSYGKIYLVEDPKTKKQYALKKIIISDSLELKENQDEYKLTWKLTKLNPELKIVKKYAIEIKKLDKYNLVMYVLMEVANCDWEQELINRHKENAYYSENELIDILKSLVNTLAELQKRGISHRDVKPQNILCFGKDGYKLSDFGEAKTKKKTFIKSNNYDENTRKQTVRGTELYMSPILFKALQMNCVDGAQYNAYKSDVFSLGMCFLLASCLNYQSLYEIREIYDMDALKEIVKRYLKNYSENYINLIINMLQINEKLRPDFIELNSMII